MEEFPEIYTRNKFNKEDFLFLDRTYVPPEGNNGTAYRLLAFMSPRSAMELAHADKVLVDGTFKVRAVPFASTALLRRWLGETGDRLCGTRRRMLGFGFGLVG